MEPRDLGCYRLVTSTLRSTCYGGRVGAYWEHYAAMPRGAKRFTQPAA